MEKTYSVVFHPSPEVIDAIKTMKDFLRSKIKWYNSCNSVAHITICEFTIDESQFGNFNQKLVKICNTFSSSTVYLNDFGSYQNSGAFFINPNEDSKNNLKPIMKKIHETLKSLKLKKSDDPHISIGRRLTPENLKIASQLFTTINMDFLCDKIVLREFDPVVKQFFVIDTIPFGNNPELEFVQGSLF
ncbi:2'-5' RNA ligase family protein [Flavobacterium sp. ASV13]|uniref:2'-5' RNA ligase family protein n=1 Tax=Flavobacterium sp. ASV13 TaxID=1506583 RepID=UPI0005561C4E|nr:2'-5' RNA ligase family protein [Flavobacterium sp. ASV13]